MFDNSICNLKEMQNQYNHPSIDKLTKILSGDAFDIESFFDVITLVEEILRNISYRSYGSAIDLVENLSNELIALEELNSLGGEISIGFPHLTIVNINLSLAIFLEKLGLYAKSYNVISKAKDPFSKPYDFIKEEGNPVLERSKDMDLFLFEMAATLPSFLSERIRKFFLERAYTDFKLLTILGDLGGEGNIGFENYKILASNKNLNTFDIKFYTNYLLLYYSNNLKSTPSIDEIIQILKSWYEIELNRNNKFLIAYTIGKVLNEKLWISKALMENGTCYREEYYEMLIRNECLKEEFDKQVIINILWEFLNKTREMYNDRMIFDLFKQKNSNLYNIVLEECIKRKEYDFLVDLTYNWNAYKPNNLNFQLVREKNIFITIPNLNNKSIFFLIRYNDNLIIVSQPVEVSLNDIFQLKNIIEGSWQLVAGQVIEFDPSILKHRYVVESSVEYIEKIREFINIIQLKNFFKEIPNEIIFEYIETTWLNIPIVSVLNSDLPNDFYVTNGYELQLPTSKVQKVLIWFNDYRMTFANFELEALKILLIEKNIELDIVKEEQLTKQLFLEKYQERTYDVLWIITHGQFDYYNPPNSYIYVSASETVSIWELQELQFARETKRRLILNACYTGCSDVRHNSMGFIGISSSLTSPYQELLGHLWFVSDLASAAIGILTMNYLLLDNEITKSNKLAINDMLAGNSKISDRLTDINPNIEIAERIKLNSQYKLEQPFYSMSSVVYK